jgi:EF-P beta-lysylation protein EpmB
MSEKEAWQSALSDLITDPKELLSLLELGDEFLTDALAAHQLFPLRVPRRFVLRMQKKDPNDPMLKQILPLGVELKKIKGYDKDPLQETKVNPVPGLLHKYYGRVLIMLTSACAINCRFCFRRHFPYEENNPGKLGLEKIFTYIRQDATISEVILSGGDPLTVSNRVLSSFTQQLSTISHVKRLRFHTRVPIVLPERINTHFIEWLTTIKLDKVVVLHANHPNEIDNTVKAVIHLLREAQITVLNQSVLLKGINDHPDIQIALSETLFSTGVLPYYLHVLDKVEGTHHFDVDLKVAIKLHEEMSKRLPGYLVPKLVCEEAGLYAKSILSSGFF